MTGPGLLEVKASVDVDQISSVLDSRMGLAHAFPDGYEDLPQREEKSRAEADTPLR